MPCHLVNNALFLSKRSITRNCQETKFPIDIFYLRDLRNQRENMSR